MADICINNLSKAYGENKVFTDYSVVIKENVTTVVTGKSGVGKTTLLNILSGIERMDEGTITGIEGKSISMVFQENRLCENLTARLNVEMVLRKGEKSREELEELFSLCGLDFNDKRPVSEYSGGMKRRVAIIRALAFEADLYLFDEPLKGLDEETYKNTLNLIKECIKGKTAVWVSHKPSEVEELGSEQLPL